MTHTTYDTTRPHVTVALSYPEPQQVGPFSVEPGPFPVVWADADTPCEGEGYHVGPVTQGPDEALCVRHLTEQGYTPPMPVYPGFGEMSPTHTLTTTDADGPYDFPHALCPTGAYLSGDDRHDSFVVSCESCQSFGVPLLVDLSDDPTHGIATCGACLLLTTREGGEFASVTLTRA